MLAGTSTPIVNHTPKFTSNIGYIPIVDVRQVGIPTHTRASVRIVASIMVVQELVNPWPVKIQAATVWKRIGMWSVSIVNWDLFIPASHLGVFHHLKELSL